MTDQGADAYEQLRSAAIGVLDAAGSQSLSEPLAHALQDLHRAVVGEISSADTEAMVLDSARHFLSGVSYVGKQRYPVTLEQKAADLRRRLDNDRGIDDSIPGHPVCNVRLTELRGMIIGSLLSELATRLSPGAAFGTARNGVALAEIARELSDEVLEQTFIGRG